MWLKYKHFGFPFFLSVLLVLIFGCNKKEYEISCTITNPKDGDEIEIGDTVAITVKLNEKEVDIKEVDFYINNALVYTSDEKPFVFYWEVIGYNIGIYKLSAKAKDGKDNYSFDLIKVTIISSDKEPIADFNADKTKVIKDSIIHFMDQSTKNPTSWLWYFGDGDSSLLQNPTHIYQTIGVFSVTLIVSSAYGSDTITKDNFITVTPDETGTVIDYDEFVYNTIKIGNQWWMSENLRSLHYSNGSPIPEIKDDTEWMDLLTSDIAMCYYNNNANNEGDIYGALYTWSTAMNGNSASNNNPSGIQGICPDGWHIPSMDEWNELFIFLGGSTGAGSKMKEIGNTHWISPNYATNESGFTALPGGCRQLNGSYTGLNRYTYFWSTSELDINNAGLGIIIEYNYYKAESYFSSKEWGRSVRCVKD